MDYRCTAPLVVKKFHHCNWGVPIYQVGFLEYPKEDNMDYEHNHWWVSIWLLYSMRKIKEDPYDLLRIQVDSKRHWEMKTIVGRSSSSLPLLWRAKWIDHVRWTDKWCGNRRSPRYFFVGPSGPKFWTVTTRTVSVTFYTRYFHLRSDVHVFFPPFFFWRFHSFSPYDEESGPDSKLFLYDVPVHFQGILWMACHGWQFLPTFFLVSMKVLRTLSFIITTKLGHSNSFCKSNWFRTSENCWPTALSGGQKYFVLS